MVAKLGRVEMTSGRGVLLPCPKSTVSEIYSKLEENRQIYTCTCTSRSFYGFLHVQNVVDELSFNKWLTN